MISDRSRLEGSSCIHAFSDGHKKCIRKRRLVAVF